ncbi:MAG: FAD binding domain-containing protein, partial [Hylemonella sp.]
MKAAAFDYTRAQDLEQALELLAQHGSEAKLIAGGQSLVPMMAMRLARPTQLVDIYRLDALRQINVQEQTVMIGAAVRQKEVQDKAELLRQLSLLA